MLLRIPGQQPLDRVGDVAADALDPLPLGEVGFSRNVTHDIIQIAEGYLLVGRGLNAASTM
jgi:hypothetical protein